MKLLNKWFLCAAIMCMLPAMSAPAFAADVAYTLDHDHTMVWCNWSHLGFSHPGADFDTISGTLMWDAADVTKSSVHVTIPVTSIHTHVPALDKILLSDKYFDAAKFPEITFTSTKVERTGIANHFRVTGKLTIHGVTQSVVMKVTLNRSALYPMLNVPALGFDATTTLKRSDFNMSEGIPFVGDEIKVHITSEALEARGYARAMKALSASGAH